MRTALDERLSKRITIFCSIPLQFQVGIEWIHPLEVKTLIQRYTLTRLVFPLLLLALGSCTAMRGKLSESKVGSNILNSYDWTSAKVGAGMEISMDRVALFIDDVDEQWLTSLLDNIGSQGTGDKDLSSQENFNFDGNLIWPVKYSRGVRLTSQFGNRWGRQHRGIDLAAKTGTPVYAIAPGKVIYAGNSMKGFGNLIIIQHKGGLSSFYAHSSSLKVKKGDVVRQGSRIALVGSTGRSTGPHLHFEIREANAAVNPCSHLPKHNIFSCSL